MASNPISSVRASCLRNDFQLPNPSLILHSSEIKQEVDEQEEETPPDVFPMFAAHVLREVEGPHEFLNKFPAFNMWNVIEGAIQQEEEMSRRGNEVRVFVHPVGLEQRKEDCLNAGRRKPVLNLDTEVGCASGGSAIIRNALDDSNQMLTQRQNSSNFEGTEGAQSNQATENHKKAKKVSKKRKLKRLKPKQKRSKKKFDSIADGEEKINNGQKRIVKKKEKSNAPPVPKFLHYAVSATRPTRCGCGARFNSSDQLMDHLKLYRVL